MTKWHVEVPGFWSPPADKCPPTSKHGASPLLLWQWSWRKNVLPVRSSRHERTGNTFLTHDSRLTTDIREKCIAIDLLEVFANRDRCILGVYTNLQIGDRLCLRKRIHHNLNHEMMVEEYSLVFTRGPSFCFFFAVLHYPSKEHTLVLPCHPIVSPTTTIQE